MPKRIVSLGILKARVEADFYLNILRDQNKDKKARRKLKLTPATLRRRAIESASRYGAADAVSFLRAVPRPSWRRLDDTARGITRIADATGSLADQAVGGVLIDAVAVWRSKRARKPALAVWRPSQVVWCDMCWRLATDSGTKTHRGKPRCEVHRTSHRTAKWWRHYRARRHRIAAFHKLSTLRHGQANNPPTVNLGAWLQKHYPRVAKRLLGHTQSRPAVVQHLDYWRDKKQEEERAAIHKEIAADPAQVVGMVLNAEAWLTALEIRSSGWGGRRSGAGGRRPGAGRPKKLSKARSGS